MSRHDTAHLDPAGQADTGPERPPVSAIRFDAPEAEVAAFRAGLAIGRRDERNRIKAALDAIQREAAPLMIEGSSFARAMAKVIGEMRRAVEGKS